MGSDEQGTCPQQSRSFVERTGRMRRSPWCEAFLRTTRALPLPRHFFVSLYAQIRAAETLAPQMDTTGLIESMMFSWVLC